MDKADIQSRRADNQIWNGALEYGFTPDFCAYDSGGEAELYLNTVIGLAYKIFNFKKFMPLLNTFQSQADGAAYSALFWLGIEGAVYSRAGAGRPALAELRREYASRVLSGTEKRSAYESVERLRTAWYGRALGMECRLDARDSAIIDGLSFPPDFTEAQICERVEEILYRYFHRARRSVTDRQWSMWVDRSINGKGKRTGQLISRTALRRIARQDAAEDGAAGRIQKAFLLMQGKTPEAVLRRYVEDVFGLSMLTPAELAAAEHELCTGAHKNCRLHFTRGMPPSRALSRETAYDAEAFKRQREKNRAYYKENAVRNRLLINRLAQRLQNTILLQRDISEDQTRAGALKTAAAWRGAALGDEKIFFRRRPEEPGELTVDILLDGSASQNRQQEKLAAQAYIIAAALTKCLVPVRVVCFCSTSGCTVLRVLKDYAGRDNDGIFDYTACGWNRDGLAMRAMGWLMRREKNDRKLLIMLSDANPNDDEKLPRKGLLPGGVYGGKAGVDDAAHEAAALRKSGIVPVCIFTGSDAELDGARKIYGRELARIPSIGWFADTVGKLIEGQIKACM